MLATWNFQVSDCHLSPEDIAALDKYVKRCKLGPFCLGRAVELKAKGTPEALQELARMRTQARQKLEKLRHIQRARLARAGPEGPEPTVAPGEPMAEPQVAAAPNPGRRFVAAI